MNPQEKRLYNKQEFKRKFGKYWLIYLALLGTATLSGISGLLLPVKGEADLFGYNIFTLLAGIYYAVGFLSNGEGAAYFWFDKLTDHDEDNATQVWIAGSMLGISVVTILVTSMAAGSFIAYVMGALSDFQILPSWAQAWVVWAIPFFWVTHFTAGTMFKAVSDEAANERTANAKIREITQKIIRDKADARARYWEEHAPDLARQMGEMEAQKEIRRYSATLGDKNHPNQ